MFYFLRTIVLYLILFVALAIGIHKGFLAYYSPTKSIDSVENQGDETENTLQSVMERIQVQPRDTVSGLILAGTVAQNQRDWGSAWKNFSQLYENFDNNPQIALKSFTLALGNGEYSEARNIAYHLKDEFFDKADERVVGQQPYDLVRIFLIVDLIKQEKFEEAAKANTDFILTNSALSEFASPIITAWVDSKIAPNTMTDATENINGMQIYYKALAAEFGRRKDIASTLFKNISTDVISLNQVISIASYFVRQNDRDEALNILKNNLERFSNNQELKKMMQILIDKPQNFKSKALSSHHLNGPQSGIALSFQDFSSVMVLEKAIDSGLLFARLAAYLDPSNPGVYASIGDILNYQGQTDEALRAYKKVIPSDDRYDEVLTKIIDISIDAKNYDEALRVIEEAMKAYTEKNAYHYFLLGNAHRAKGDFKEAIEAYDMAEVLGKHDGPLDEKLWPLYYSRAVSFDFLDKWDDAEKDLLIALDKFPDSAVILNYLGYAYADKGINLDKAKEMILKAVAISPMDAYIIDSMGWVYYRLGEYDKAVTYLERATSLRPYHMVINDHLGDAYWKVGRKIEAYYMWQRALDYFDPTEEDQVRMIDETRRKLKEGLDKQS